MRVNWICHFGDHTNLCNFHLNIYIQSALNSPDLMARCLDRKDMWRQKSLKCSFEPISPTSQYRDRKDSVTKKTLKCSFEQNFEQKSLKSSFEPISPISPPDLTAQSLDKKDLFSESDPFYIVYRTNPDGSETLVITFDVWWHVFVASSVWSIFLLSSTTVSVCCAPKKVK